MNHTANSTELERALLLAAEAVVRYGDAAAPMLDRIEREVEEERRRGGQRARAQRILAEREITIARGA